MNFADAHEIRKLAKTNDCYLSAPVYEFHHLVKKIRGSANLFRFLEKALLLSINQQDIIIACEAILTYTT